MVLPVFCEVAEVFDVEQRRHVTMKLSQPRVSAQIQAQRSRREQRRDQRLATISRLSGEFAKEAHEKHLVVSRFFQNGLPEEETPHAHL